MNVNVTATDAQLIWSGHGNLVKSKKDRGTFEVFETAFNAACSSIGRGEFGQALVLLKMSKSMLSQKGELQGGLRDIRLIGGRPV